MCDACVIQSVKERMLSRRGFFRAAAAGTAGIAAASMGIAPPALAAGHTGVTDLTHELHEEFPTFFGQQQ
ncbi:MAG TPA: cyclase family protein, partial [Sinorhizobium sp.]|nr:cyclase family protein [Sinorhizobium sp.]